MSLSNGLLNEDLIHMEKSENTLAPMTTVSMLKLTFLVLLSRT